MNRWLAAGLAALLLVPLLFVAALAGALPARPATDAEGPSEAALVGLPPAYLADQALAEDGVYVAGPAIAAGGGDARALAAQVLVNPRITVYDGGRADIAAGIVDARVLALLQTLSARWELTVTSLKAGH